MAARVHSVRFMIGRGGNRTETYTVPAGRRAVVRAWHVQPWGSGGVHFYVRIHGIVIAWTYCAPGTPEERSRATYEARWTAYAGETISMIVEGTDGAYSIDGFLFFDDAVEPDDADNTIVAA